MNAAPAALSQSRRRTSLALRGIELPDCFALSTAAAEARLLTIPAGERTVSQRRDLRRISSKALRLEASR